MVLFPGGTKWVDQVTGNFDTAKRVMRQCFFFELAWTMGMISLCPLGVFHRNQQYRYPALAAYFMGHASGPESRHPRFAVSGQYNDIRLQLPGDGHDDVRRITAPDMGACSKSFAFQLIG